MAKQFIRVSKTYATKNKVQLLMLQKLQTVNHTLTLTHVQASRLIKKLYDEAVQEYNGKAAIPELKTYDNDNTTSYHVEDVIYIDIHSIVNDLS
jgi:hypothetical protein